MCASAQTIITPTEIGEPVSPGLRRWEVGRRERLEDQRWHGDGEDEIGEAFARAIPTKPEMPSRKAEGHQAEDRQDDGEDVQHRDARTAVTGRSAACA